VSPLGFVIVLDNEGAVGRGGSRLAVGYGHNKSKEKQSDQRATDGNHGILLSAASLLVHQGRVGIKGRLQGSFDCVAVRFENDDFAQDDNSLNTWSGLASNEPDTMQFLLASPPERRPY
jgi:hypothetical protein